MTKFTSAALVILCASAVTAEETRQLDAHEHGVGQLDIAFDGDQIAMELHAPGADIVGFEYAAKSDEDRASIETAIATLSRPLDLFALPAAAGCSVVGSSASLESDAEHDEHGHDEHGHDAHKDDAHGDEEHDHDKHAHDEEGHEGHDHADHDEEGHKDADHDHDHAEHADESGHTEFHAEYLLNCTDPSAATMITFAYFDAFPNALELEVQVISDTGATAFEVPRSAPELDLSGIF